jgi:hypothetical protein
VPPLQWNCLREWIDACRWALSVTAASYVYTVELPRCFRSCRDGRIAEPGPLFLFTSPRNVGSERYTRLLRLLYLFVY